MPVFEQTDVVGITCRVDKRGRKTHRVFNGDEYVGTTKEGMQKAKLLLTQAGGTIRHREDAEHELALWKALYPQFADWMPCDYLTHRGLMKSTDGTKDIRQSPAVYQLWIRAKESEMRDLILGWFASRSCQEKLDLLKITSPVPSEANHAGRLLHDCLRQSILGMREVDRTWANENLNVQVSFHSGWLKMCQDVKVLVRAEGGMHFGDGERRYQIKPFGPSCLAAFRVVHKTQTIFMMQGAPTDVLAWERTMEAIECGIGSIQENTGALGDGTTYRGRWTRRATLEGERMASGTDKSFAVPTNMSVARFGQLFPDQNGHLQRWSRYLGEKNIDKFISRLGYIGNVNFLTMHMCLFMDPRVKALDPKMLKLGKVKKRIVKLRKSMRGPGGLEGHPANVCLAAVADL